MSDHLPHTVRFFVDEDKNLQPDGLVNSIRLEQFIKLLEKGVKIDVTYEVINDDASYGQLSKVHACIRAIAKECGHSFIEIKKEVKQRAGLFSEPEVLKSFAVCSKGELDAAIQACIILGEELNMNLTTF